MGSELSKSPLCPQAVLALILFQLRNSPHFLTSTLPPDHIVSLCTQTLSHKHLHSDPFQDRVNVLAIEILKELLNKHQDQIVITSEVLQALIKVIEDGEQSTKECYLNRLVLDVIVYVI